jgi:amino acid efflux transporter
MSAPLTFARGTALYVAAVLGPGVLTLPALAAHVAGPAFLIPLVLILVLSALLAATFTALGRRTGGASDLAGYVSTAFGQRSGLVVGLLFYVGVPPGVAALGLFGGQYVQAAVGGGATPVIVAAVLIAATYATNSVGLHFSSSVQVVMTSVLVGLLLVTFALSVGHMDASHFTPIAPHGWTAIGPAAFLLVWVLTGWEASANLYSSLDPASVVKVAAAAVLIIATAFGAISVLVLGVLDADSTSVAPVAELLGIVLGPTGVFVAAVLALILTFGNMNAYVAGLGAIGRGLTVDRLPWRIPPLAIPTAIAILSLVLTTGKHDAARMLVGVTAASQVPVLLLSCLAALRLLDRFTAAWWSAALASMAVAALLVPAGLYLVAPTTIALVTVAGGWWHTRAVLREGSRHRGDRRPRGYTPIEMSTADRAKPDPAGRAGPGTQAPRKPPAERAW